MEKIDPKMVEDLKEWVRGEAKGLDDAQAALLLSMLEMVSVLLKNKTTQKKAVETLRTLMGILPKSERSKTDKFSIPSNETESASSEKSALEKQIQLLILKHRKLFSNKSNRHAEGKSARHRRNNSRQGGEDVIYNQTGRESEEKSCGVPVNKAENFTNQIGLRTSTEVHSRFDLDVKVTEILLSVETVTDPATGRSVRASTTKFGPENWQVTWNAMVNIVHLVVVFSMPASRAAAFLHNDRKAFGESTIHRIVQYVAGACAPVYLHIFHQIAQSRRIQGDDSSSRVLEIERKVKNDEMITKIDSTNEENSQSKDPIEVEPDLISSMEKIDQKVGFHFSTKTGKPKRKLQVTMATGRIHAEDQFSQISFVRTHLGSFGNLLDKIFAERETKNSDVTVQSDLSTSNLPSETKNFNVTYAGCLSHARRPFWRYRDVDPLNCYYLLRGFALLSSVEDIIDIRDRTEEVTLYWREKYSAKIWRIIKARCEKMMLEHMPNSELHISAKYIVSHFSELTYYLTDDWVHATNNQVERILRSERTMLNNSKFRQSKKGRCAFDILRTIQLCCAGAQVPVMDYLKWMLPNFKKVTLSPVDWTPYSYRKSILKK